VRLHVLLHERCSGLFQSMLTCPQKRKLFVTHTLGDSSSTYAALDFVVSLSFFQRAPLFKQVGWCTNLELPAHAKTLTDSAALLRS